MENYVSFLLFVKMYGEKNGVYFKRLILVNIINLRELCVKVWYVIYSNILIVIRYVYYKNYWYFILKL